MIVFTNLKFIKMLTQFISEHIKYLPLVLSILLFTKALLERRKEVRLYNSGRITEIHKAWAVRSVAVVFGVLMMMFFLIQL